MSAKKVIEKFGSQTKLAKLIGKGQSVVAYWAKTDIVPTKWHATLLELAKLHGIDLKAEDFMPLSKIPSARIPIPNNMLTISNTQLQSAPKQGVLDLQIEKQIEIDGIGMGVLTDGTPFLTGRGLSRLCGVNNARIVELGQDWLKEVPTPLVYGVKKLLQERGVEQEHPYIEVNQRNGIFYAFPDSVCLAVLEYYAFDAPNKIEQAQKNYRLLAGKALHDFIYTQVGYDPNNFVPVAWQQFHDRVSLTYNSIPVGFFSIFKEIADMIVTLGQAGLHIDSSFVPDISVGLSWGKHWTNNNLDVKYGERKKWNHNYPANFPQSVSNPQEVWCYPELALAEFRKWMRDIYIGEGKLSNYVNNKIVQQQLPASFAQLVIKAYNLE